MYAERGGGRSGRVSVLENGEWGSVLAFFQVNKCWKTKKGRGRG